MDANLAQIGRQTPCVIMASFHQGLALAPAPKREFIDDYLIPHKGILLDHLFGAVEARHVVNEQPPNRLAGAIAHRRTENHGLLVHFRLHVVEMIGKSLLELRPTGPRSVDRYDLSAAIKIALSR